MLAIRIGYSPKIMGVFDPYQEVKSTGPQGKTTCIWGLGENVVLELLVVFPKEPSSHLFMDIFSLACG